MNRYIKIENYDNWFIAFNNGDALPDRFSKVSKEKAIKSEFQKIFDNKDDDKSQIIRKRIEYLSNNTIDYNSLSEKYGTLLIRENGSWMTLDDNRIVSEKFENRFPNDDIFADVVICENDEFAEKAWVEYLKDRFPSKTISTINFFSLRETEEVKEIFNKAEYITFSTTFTDLFWFEKLTQALNDSNKVIGHCHIQENWTKALRINENVEVIKLNDLLTLK